MKVYPDYEPETVTLHGITNEGRPVSVDYYTDGKTVIPKAYGLEHAKTHFSTHRKCKTCGKVLEGTTKITCNECSDKNDYEKYLSLPLVELQFPIFVNDDFIEDEDSLNDYLYYNEITSEENVEVHNSKLEPIRVNIIDYLDDVLENTGYEDSLKDLISNDNYKKLTEYEDEIQSVMDSIHSMYFADYKSRVSIKDYLMNELGEYLG